jgi:hypothetical protein
MFSITDRSVYYVCQTKPVDIPENPTKMKNIFSTYAIDERHCDECKGCNGKQMRNKAQESTKKEGFTFVGRINNRKQQSKVAPAGG